METQKTISDWALATFGPAGSSARIAARANEEMAELLRAVTVDDRHSKAAEEIADIFIVLYRLAERLGFDVQQAIEHKMAINRAREWRLDGSGHGYHVEKPKPTELCKCNHSFEFHMSKAMDGSTPCITAHCACMVFRPMVGLS